MRRKSYLLDTHALIFWHNRIEVSEDFIRFFDRQAQQGTLYVSSVSFWEIAFLVKKGKLILPDVHAWKNELLNHSNLYLIDPSASEMIDSTLLPDHHADPFDRLLIAQCNRRGLILVTRNEHIHRYAVEHIWL